MRNMKYFARNSVFEDLIQQITIFLFENVIPNFSFHGIDLIGYLG